VKCFLVSASKGGLGMIREMAMTLGLAQESRSRQVNLKSLGSKKGGLLDGLDGGAEDAWEVMVGAEAGDVVDAYNGG